MLAARNSGGGSIKGSSAGFQPMMPTPGMAAHDIWRLVVANGLGYGGSYNNGYLSGPMGNMYIPPEWLEPSPAFQLQQFNAQLPAELQITGKEGEQAKSTAMNDYMRNTGNPAVAKAKTSEGDPNVKNSFASARTAQLQAAHSANAQGVGDAARNSEINRINSLRSSYTGVPFRSGQYGAARMSGGGGGGYSADAGGGTLGNVTRALYGADRFTGGAITDGANSLARGIGRAAVDGFGKLFGGGFSNPFANRMNQGSSSNPFEDVFGDWGYDY